MSQQGSRRASNGQGDAHRDPPKGSKAWERQQYDTNTLETLISDDLDDRTKVLLKNFLVKDLPLGNFTEAELHEFRWLLENRELEIFLAHPPQESVVQGTIRQAWLDDKRREETSLTAPQRKKIREIKEIVKNRARRGREGWQQAEISKQRRVTEQHRHDETSDSDDGGIV